MDKHIGIANAPCLQPQAFGGDAADTALPSIMNLQIMQRKTLARWNPIHPSRGIEKIEFDRSVLVVETPFDRRGAGKRQVIDFRPVTETYGKLVEREKHAKRAGKDLKHGKLL